jgi:hypothetical protein
MYNTTTMPVARRIRVRAFITSVESINGTKNNINEKKATPVLIRTSPLIPKTLDGTIRSV